MTMALRAAVGLLACPLCGHEIGLTPAAAVCDSGHSFDIARQGYLNLLGGPQPANADTPVMLAARARVLESGCFDPLLDLVTAATRDGRAILEVGSGTAHYLRRALGDDPGHRGIALDVSTAAAKRAAQADVRIAAVVADVWKPLPLRNRSVDVVLAVFAPRNLAEFARVLTIEGRLVVAVPNPGHLAGLRAREGLLDIEPEKEGRLLAAASEFFTKVATSRTRHRRDLTATDAADLVTMGRTSGRADPASRRADAAGQHPAPRDPPASGSGLRRAGDG
ncbi:MAG: methyltransferase domain-containing protein [Propionibacteriaceae bacterium]|nr:methyltransferase domain-containing protein [Propionibacteriaceae bacterium]